MPCLCVWVKLHPRGGQLAIRSSYPRGSRLESSEDAHFLEAISRSMSVISPFLRRALLVSPTNARIGFSFGEIRGGPDTQMD